MSRNYQDLDSFVVLLCTQGKAKITAMNKTYTLEQGELLFIPASLTEILIQTDELKSTLLETYIP
jgi:mannose-6-phosphate isomerase